jgi:hypothetical protein
MEDDAQARLAELPSELLEILEELLEQPLQDLEGLIEEVVSYRVEVGEMFGVNSDFADEELAAMLAARTVELLERVAGEYSEHDHQLAQAAARYLISDDDVNDDLGSPIGFDDDKEIFNSIVEAMGHDDLAIL